MTLATVMILAVATAGWENVCSNRTEFAPVDVLWRADFSVRGGFTWELRDGAKGTVDVMRDGIRIEKTNDEGSIVVKAKPFAVTPGRAVRFSADQVGLEADVDTASGALRYHGKTEGRLGLDVKAERKNFWEGGTQTMRAIPCTAPGMSYRKYGQCYAKDDVLTPVIVVSGTPSKSVWRNWLAEDFEKSDKAWIAHEETFGQNSHLADRMDEEEFWRKVKADGPHAAAVRTLDGVSRLMVDGVVSAPVLYKASHVWEYWAKRDNGSFAGGRLNGSAVKLMVVSTHPWQFCSNNVLDVTYMVKELKDAMRLAPDSYFVLGISVRAPADFISKYHPDEAWISEKGEPVVGLDNTCVVGFGAFRDESVRKQAFIWPSPSSPAWRDWVKSCIRTYVAELKRLGLDKRVVGVHFYGYNDQQMTPCYIDRSPCARAEVARMLAEQDSLTTNYNYLVRLCGQRALNEFARTFKAEMAKPVIAIKWSQSPFGATRMAASDISDFVRCDALDVIVCQSNYRERQPGFPTVSVMPMESLHLHGKLYLNELDVRTYARPVRDVRTWPSKKSLGIAQDFPMWQSIYRKFAGEADARRMGYWLYDMQHGWFDTPELAEDIRALAAEEQALARQKPSSWRPDVVLVADETQIVDEGSDPLAWNRTHSYIYFEQCRSLATSGVPYESYLGADVWSHPELLDGKKVVVFAFLYDIDARRAAVLKRLAAQGTTLVFLSETGVKGGAAVTGFEPVLTKGRISQRIVGGTADQIVSPVATMEMRDLGDGDIKDGDRMTVRETPQTKALARYAADGLPAVIERNDPDCRRVYVAAAGALSPTLMNRLAREAGAYRALSRPGVQMDMNGDFLSLHCLQPGTYDVTLPFDCRVLNLKTHEPERVTNRMFVVTLTAGETCRFRLERDPLESYVSQFLKDDVETKTNAVPNAAAYGFLRENAPVFECPDKEIERAYYFRWWTYRRHIKETPSGFVVTEFLPDVSWAGKYNTINCAAGHHVMEGRWLKDPKYIDDYVRFLMREGAMTGRYAYVCWLAYATVERAKLTGDWRLAIELLDAFVTTYETWEKGWLRRPFPYKDPNERFQMGLRANGLFASTDDREGSENSLGGDGQRPLVNSAMAGEAKAIAEIARHAGRAELAESFEARSAALVAKMKELLWNPDRSFFTVLDDAGDHKSVRELFGYSPWYFGLDMTGHGAAWQYVMKTDGFLAPCGLANPEISDPRFAVAYRDLTKTACRRDGPSWPYETSIVLTALANALQTGRDTSGVDANAYLLLLRQYAVAHKLTLDDGRTVSWVDENFDPFSGDWVARRIYLLKGASAQYGRGKDYNHSTFCDLVLSGLCGIRPQADGSVGLKPLAPKDWDYWRVSNARVAGREIEVIWDRTGEKYGRGAGLSLFADGVCMLRRTSLR